jgi:hypothetical protein
MDTGGILGDDVAVAVAATGGASDRLAVRMIAGNGIVAGCAAEFCMCCMAEASRIDIILTVDLCLISVAGHAGNVLAHSVAERIVSALCLASDCNTGHK